MQPFGPSARAAGRVIAATTRRAAATTAPAPAAGAAAKTVVKQRSAYQAQMTELRKTWGTEIARKEQREADRRAAEQQRLVLEKAIRLREKRKASLARQEQAKKKREEALDRYREKLARNHIVHAQRVAVQNESFKNLIDTLEAESSSWITLDNIDSKITEELFAAPATTGLVTSESRHWRHQLLTIQLKRMLSPEFVTESNSNGSLADRLQQRGQAKSVKRLLLQEFLEPMIGSGQERANQQEILDKFAAEMEGHFVVDEELDTYLDYVMSKDTNFDDLDEELDAGDGMGGGADEGGDGDDPAELAKLRLQDEEEAAAGGAGAGMGAGSGSSSSSLGADAVPIDADLPVDKAELLDESDVDRRPKSKAPRKPPSH